MAIFVDSGITQHCFYFEMGRRIILLHMCQTTLNFRMLRILQMPQFCTFQSQQNCETFTKALLYRTINKNTDFTESRKHTELVSRAIYFTLFFIFIYLLFLVLYDNHEGVTSRIQNEHQRMSLFSFVKYVRDVHFVFVLISVCCQGKYQSLSKKNNLCNKVF